MAMEEPQITRTDPQAYYYWLISQGMNAYQASTMVNQRFPKPEQKTPEQQQREAGKQQQTAVVAQTGGMVGGVIAGRYVYNKASGWIDQLTGAKVSEEVVKNAAQQSGQSLTTSGASATQGAGSAGAQVASPTQGAQAGGATQGATAGGMSTMQPAVSNNVVPQGAAIPEGYTAVGTSANGGTIVAPSSQVDKLPTTDPGFLETVNWPAVVQGAVSVAQLYSAYQSYKKGDYVGAGLSGAAGVTMGAAAANAAGASFAGSQTLAAAAPYAGIAAGAYGGYQTAKYTGDAAAGAQRNRNAALQGAASGAALGASVGTLIPIPGVGTGVGAVIGATVGGLAGLAGSYFGSSKDKYQMIRDRAREGLVKANILDANYQGTLADGSTFDFGKDGKKFGKLNTKDPNWGAAAGLANVIAAGEGLYGRPLEAVATLYANASMSNANGDINKVYENIRHFAAQRNMSLDNVTQQLDKLKTDQLINDEQYNAYLNGARTIFGTQPQQQQIQRPAKGQVARVSPGMYMNDKGQVKPAASVRQALQQNYDKSKTKGRR